MLESLPVRCDIGTPVSGHFLGDFDPILHRLQADLLCGHDSASIGIPNAFIDGGEGLLVFFVNNWSLEVELVKNVKGPTSHAREREKWGTRLGDISLEGK